MKGLCVACPPWVSNSWLEGPFLHQITHVFVLGMLVISILRQSDSILLPCAFQLNKNFSRTGPLCLCSSLRLLVLAIQGSTSVSLSTIITAITALTATWLSIAWMFLDSAISAWLTISALWIFICFLECLFLHGLRLFLLTLCNVTNLECNNTDVV